jgi:UDP-N-acetylmuramoyl-tripeptide--D-alanyl-D-alanine ligase
LITNVGLAHIEGFGSFEGVVKGKTELYQYLTAHNGKIFVNAENEILLQKISDFGFRISGSEKVITYGKSFSAFCPGEIFESEEFLKVKTEAEKIQTNLVGAYNFENVMSAVCVGKFFGVPAAEIKTAIENYVPSNNRSQKIQLGSNTIILDAYNANPSSMFEALKNFETMDGKNKVVVLGEMMELGDTAKAEHEKIKTFTDKMSLTQKVFVGNGFRFLQNDSAARWFEKTDEAKAWFKQQHFEHALILIKGSRKNELEKILKE